MSGLKNRITRWVLDRVRPARALCAVAGSPAGVTRSRRGSVLILVIGTLAMMSVLAVVFVTVGRSDRRSASAVEKRAVRDDVPEQVRDYVASVIGADVISAFPAADTLGNNAPAYLLRRESWDIPSSDPRVMSVPSRGINIEPRVSSVGNRAQWSLWSFNPAGHHIGLTAGDEDGTSPSLRWWSDPWLASDFPENLVFNDDLPTPTNNGIPPIATLAEGGYYNARDYLQISNFAPDGRAVNLWNLRNNFDAPSDYQNPGDISYGLTLYDTQHAPQAFGTPQERIRRNPTDDRNAHPNRPSDWFSYQRGMAVAVTGGNLTWDDPRYKAYQYADADGDGILDARWIELIDATDPNNPVAKIIDPTGRYRYVFAFKAVDLSGRVNLNVATDQISPPSEEFRVGATPADIDARRLLMLEDQRQERLVSGLPADNYRFLEPPKLPGSTNIDTRSPQYYDNYTSTDGNRQDVGDRAYNALRMFAASGVLPPQTVTGDTLGTYFQINFPALATPSNRYYFTASFPTQWELSARGRFEHFNSLGASGEAYTGEDDLNGGWQYRLAQGYGLADLQELLTYNGVNDPDVTSALEAAVGGRSDRAPNLDPLRSNRGLSIERGDRDNVDLVATQRKTAPDSDADWDDTDADAYLQFAVDIRRMVTTLSGARPLQSVVLGDSAGALGDGDVKYSLPRLLEDLISTNTETKEDAHQDLFSAFVLGLTPYGLEEVAWTIKGRTLNYGYVSPQAGIRLAAHMVSNWNAAVREEDQADRTASRDKADAVIVGMRNANPSTPWQGGTNVMEVLNENRRNDDDPLWVTTAMGTDVPDAVVAFPIEAHPFITEVAMASLYTDAPNSIAGGDSEEDNISPSGFPGRPTINPNAHYLPTVTTSNPDYIFEALAVQLQNPYSHAVSSADVFYIEVVRQDQNDPLARQTFYYRFTLPTGLDSMHEVGGTDTATVLMLSNPIDAIDQKLLNCARGYTVPGDNTLLGQKLLGKLFAGDVLSYGSLINAERVDRDTLMALPQQQGFLHNWFPTSMNFSSTGTYQLVSEVRLWRRPDAAATNHDADILVDRLRVPLEATNPIASAPLNRIMRPAVGQSKAPNAGYEVRGRFAGEEKTDASDDMNPNQGMTIMLYGSVRRPTDETFIPVGATTPPRAFPMWCVEGRREGILTETAWNMPDRDNQGDLTVFRSQDILLEEMQNRYYRFEEFVSDVRGGITGTDALDVVLTADHPKDKIDTADNALVNTNEAGQPIRLNRIEALGYVDPTRVRTADALLPLAIGPEWATDATTVADVREADRWMTTSQALAIAMGMHRSADAALGTDIPQELDDLGPVKFYAQVRVGDDPNANPTGSKPLGAAHMPRPPQTQEFTVDQVLAGPILKGFLDRGHIVLDDYVPYYYAGSAAANMLVPPVRYRLGTDTAMGLGLTPAMLVLESFQGLADEFGGRTTATPGVVNLNNAPRTVLRTLPMLSPTHDRRPEDNVEGWWWPSGRVNRGTDIASMVAAYRDRGVLADRYVQPGELGRPVIDFSGSNRPTATTYGARANVNYISALRDDRGFVSVAELFAAKRRNPDLIGTDGLRNRHAIDSLGTPTTWAGYQPTSINLAGVDSVRYNGGIEDDGIGDDFDQKLAIANAVMNTASVRSDYFAVWFVMHGYSRSDVENLNPGDPMIPSVARRFMMVLDRSSVTGPGQMPRIVLFKEVPM